MRILLAMAQRRAIALLILLSGLALGFFVWAPWSSAISPEECMSRYNRAVPAEWEAVIVDHGNFIECRRGLPASHPLAFALFGLLYIGSGVALPFAVGRFSFKRRSMNMPGTATKDAS